MDSLARTNVAHDAFQNFPFTVGKLNHNHDIVRPSGEQPNKNCLRIVEKYSIFEPYHVVWYCNATNLEQTIEKPLPWWRAVAVH